jgi:hypothetical protein
MAVAFVALMVALGGSSYAATKLAANSVGSRELKRNAVTSRDIKNSAVTSAKIANGSITGDDLKMAALGQVPLAARAASTGNADHAGSSGALDKVTYRNVTGSVGPGTATTTTVSSPVSVGCDAGQALVGGGVHVEDPDSMAAHESYPATANTWTAVVGNDDDVSGHSFTVYAICVPAGSVG